MEKGYAICLNEWLDDTKITGDLNLLLRISSLTAKEGFCFASNEYFAKKLGITAISVSRKIKKLERLGYITIEYKRRGCQIVKRFLRLTQMLTDDYHKRQSTINMNVKDNNTSINNTSINTTNVVQAKPDSPQEFGNPAINEMLKNLKLATGRDDFKESQQWQRRYALHFLNLVKKIGVEEFKNRFTNIFSDSFKSKNCNSLKYLYSEMKSAQTSEGLKPTQGIYNF